MEAREEDWEEGAPTREAVIALAPEPMAASCSEREGRLPGTADLEGSGTGAEGAGAGTSRLQKEGSGCCGCWGVDEAGVGTGEGTSGNFDAEGCRTPAP